MIYPVGLKLETSNWVKLISSQGIITNDRISVLGSHSGCSMPYEVSTN